MNLSRLISSAFSILVLCLIVKSSFATEIPVSLSANEKAFLTVASVKITPTADITPLISPCLLSLAECPIELPRGQIVLPRSGIGDIIAIGESLWKIVEAGKPSAHIVSNSVSALPRENPHWTLLTNWQGPMVKGYHMEVVNKLGIKVVSMDYKIIAYYGGKWKGKGQYLTNLTMISDNVSVAWGYDLRATAELMDLINTADSENPVPGCTMQMKWKTDTAVQHREGSHAVFIKGDGSAKDLN